MISTSLEISDLNVYQGSGDTLTLSGTTKIVGDLFLVNKIVRIESDYVITNADNNKIFDVSGTSVTGVTIFFANLSDGVRFKVINYMHDKSVFFWILDVDGNVLGQEYCFLLPGCSASFYADDHFVKCADDSGLRVNTTD